MQAIKDKITDLNEIRKAKSEAKQEQKAEKEIEKARAEVANEVRLAREAEAAMDMHVKRAIDKAAQHEAKLAGTNNMKQTSHDGDGLNSQQHGPDYRYAS